MMLRPHSKEWYDRLSTMQDGYERQVPYETAWGNGEDAFLDTVKMHLTPQMDVAESGCAEGTVAIELAPLCHSITAYDRVESFIELARKKAHQASVGNAIFLCADSSPEANNGTARLPLADNSVDMIISRRGPLHWIPDARRVVRSGGLLIQLCMLEWRSPPTWNEDLPKSLQQNQDYLGESMRMAVEQHLAEGGLELHSCWEYDVPVFLPRPEVFYEVLTVGRTPDEVPPYDTVESILVGIFERYGSHGRFALRQRRFLWKAMVT